MIQIRKSSVYFAVLVMIAAVGAFVVTTSVIRTGDPVGDGSSDVATPDVNAIKSLPSDVAGSGILSIETGDNDDDPLGRTAADTSGSPGDEEVVVVLVDVVLANSLEELEAAASVILVGRVKGTLGIVNLTKDPINHELPNKKIYGVGRIYDIEVTEQIKGRTSDTIELVQYELSVRLDDPDTDLESIASAGPDYGTAALTMDQEYVMFLTEAASGFGRYALAMDPYRFLLVDGLAISEGSVHEADGKLGTYDAEELLARLRSN